MSLVNTAAEPLFTQQWHLQNTGQTGGTSGADINVLPAWQSVTGSGVTIAINDTGIDLTQPDLAANIDTARGDNFRDSSGDGSPDDFYDTAEHGTLVAGMAAADNNGTGVLGAAPDATLVSLVGLGEIGAIAAYDQFDIVNNSWGYTELFFDDFNRPQFQDDADELRDAVTNGRGGLGTVIVFAAGNAFDPGGRGIFTGFDNANYHNFQNSRFTIAVAALDEDGTFNAPGTQAGFSTPGAPVLISAPGTEVLTTDIAGSSGATAGDTAIASGTSFASPLVAGVVALILEANRNLGYRDVQEILAYSAVRNDADQGQWGINGAGTWNLGGLHTNDNYGFGLVDAHAAVRLAETWTQQKTIDEEVFVDAGNAAGAAIGFAEPVQQTVTLAPGVSIETVEVAINLSHDRLGNLTIAITSPAGTVSTLMLQPGAGALGGGTLDFTFTSNEFLGESSEGTWTLTVSDATPFFSGTLSSWELTAFGSPDTDDDTYVFTDEYVAVASVDAGRQFLTDTEGFDQINAAAVTGNVDIDLNPGATSTIAGTAFGLSTDTLIEEAFGGDGNDMLRGNRLDNRLDGGRGDDTFVTGGGSDLIVGGFGRDVLQAQTDGAAVTVGADSDGNVVVSLPSGTVTTVGIELIVLDDRAVLAAAPSSLFDPTFYLQTNRDVAAVFTEDTAFDHFQQFGKQEGRDPNALFDTDFYLTGNADVGEAVVAGVTTAYDHFVIFGWPEGRDPSPYFDTEAYQAENPDVAAAAVNPLDHYLIFGALEGRFAPLADTSILL